MLWTSGLYESESVPPILFSHEGSTKKWDRLFNEVEEGCGDHNYTGATKVAGHNLKARRQT